MFPLVVGFEIMTTSLVFIVLFQDERPMDNNFFCGILFIVRRMHEPMYGPVPYQKICTVLPLRFQSPKACKCLQNVSSLLANQNKMQKSGFHRNRSVYKLSV